MDDLIGDRGAPALINALTEATELTDIHKGLSRLPDPHIIPKLGQFVGGAVMLQDETAAANQPRNVGFEMASECNRLRLFCRSVQGETG
jgi:hypothetical protein